MYIDPQLSVPRLPARSPQPRFTARPLASSLVMHGAAAAALLLLAHRAIMPTAPEMPPVPMVFLPPAPAAAAPVPPAELEPAPAPAPPQESEPAIPPEALAPPPLEQPAPAPKPEATPARPPPIAKATRPVRPRPEPEVRHAAPHPRPVPVRQEPQRATAEPTPQVPPPAAPAAPTAAESGPVVPPHALTEAAGNRPPYYPDRAKRDGEQGRVILRVDVSVEGRAATVAVLRSSGFSDLDQSAAEAVRGWRFIAATRGGRAIPGVAEVPVAFTLADQ